MLRSKAPKLCRGLWPLAPSAQSAARISTTTIAPAGDQLDPAQTPLQQKVSLLQPLDYHFIQLRIENLSFTFMFPP